MPDTTQLYSAPVAVLGATGYIGGRLVPKLLNAGYRVRAVSRSRKKLFGRPYSSHPGLETAEADAMDRSSLEEALQGCRVVFDLIQASPDQRDDEPRAKANLVPACQSAGVSRIIELSLMVPETAGRSKSDRPAAERPAFEDRRASPVPVTRLRSSMIIGSGSLAFEVLRYLTERLPLMLAPGWVFSRCQPIAVQDVLDYLLGCLENEQTAGLDLETGGPDQVTFREMIGLYAREAGLPGRLVIKLPMCLPRLSSYWINLVTPIPASFARPLVRSLTRDNPVHNASIRDVLPMELTPVRKAISAAIEQTRSLQIATCWSDAGELTPPEWLMSSETRFAGGRIFECNYSIHLGCPPEKIWSVIRSAGGTTGWFYSNLLWRLRGSMDRLIGGVGLSRGRREPDVIRPGDALDFWRVLKVEDNRELMLLAEMKAPGDAVLHLSLHPKSDGSTELMQIARFLPRGLFGLIYWYGLAPSHAFLFKGMLRRIARLSGCPILRGPEKFTGGEAVCRLPDEDRVDAGPFS
jgi:uncharacterized protein YbjT (DUF2867 family)